MTERVTIGQLNIAKVLSDLLENEISPGTGVSSGHFWSEMESVLKEFVPRNRALLAKRDELQSKIDSWHQGHAGQQIDEVEYTAFLREIGYLLEEGPDFEITTQNVDEEIALTAGPQLVVPVMNARFSLNAANARWGSLYDALYGTDVIPESDGAEKGGAYNTVRGDRVIAYAANFLDETYPLQGAQHRDAVQYRIVEGAVEVQLENGETTGLANPAQFMGYLGEEGEPSGILLKHNGLHIEVQIDREDSIGKNEKAGVKDILVEYLL